MDKKEFGARLRFVRKNLKMKKEEFSENIGITTGFLNEVECGAKGISLETIEKICEFTGVSSDFLILGKENLSNTKTPTADLLEQIPNKYTAIVCENLKNLLTLINRIEDENKKNDD